MSLNKSFSSSIAQACDHIKKNKALIITCGAGMSVDSGLPDFRGPKGFYKCYPEIEKMNLTFNQCANPNFFSKFPKMAWYFYG